MKKVTSHFILACCLLGSGISGAVASEEAMPAKEVVAAASQVVPAGAPVMANRIEILVGNEIITTTEIEEPLKQLREHYSQKIRGPELDAKMLETRQMHLERLVESKLLLLEAREQKIELQDNMIEEQVDKEIENVKAQFPNQEAFREQLAKERLSESEFRKQRELMVREGLLRQRLLQEKIQEFKTGVEVSDTQLQEYYTKNKEKFLQPSRAHVSQIFVDRPDTGLATAEFNRLYQAARDKARRALSELQAGKAFADVARRYSEHKITSEKGGDIGWIEKGDIDLPEFEKVVFEKLEVGKYSDVIETARGLFVLKLEDRQLGGELPFAEVRGRIRMEMMAEGSEKRYKAWLETLKKKFKIQYAEKKA